jgi:hypothetical protein
MPSPQLAQPILARKLERAGANFASPAEKIALNRNLHVSNLEIYHHNKEYLQEE